MRLNYQIGKSNVTGKSNITIDSLSRISMSSLSYLNKKKRGLVKDNHRLANLGACFLNSKDEKLIVQDMVKSSLSIKVKKK